MKYFTLEEEIRINELAIIGILEHNITPLLVNNPIDKDLAVKGLEEMDLLVIESLPLKLAPAVTAGLLRDALWAKYERTVITLPPQAIVLSEFGLSEPYNAKKRYLNIRDNIYQAFPAFIAPPSEIEIETVAI